MVSLAYDAPSFLTACAPAGMVLVAGIFPGVGIICSCSIGKIVLLAGANGSGESGNCATKLLVKASINTKAI